MIYFELFHWVFYLEFHLFLIKINSAVELNQVRV